uniref:uncharacterized protein LOC120331347 n=1 Tax=Styela clava TaxID=7725 RepID=UPI0019396150|nr:uncharacterized protein LOC120331347 [Styela clava]
MEARLAQHICFKTHKEKRTKHSTSSIEDNTKEKSANKPIFKIHDTDINNRSISPHHYVSPMASISAKSFLLPPRMDNRNRLTSTPNQEQLQLSDGIKIQNDAAFDFSPLACERTSHNDDGLHMDDIKSVLFPTLHPKSNNMDMEDSITEMEQSCSSEMNPIFPHIAKPAVHQNPNTSIEVTKPVFPNFFGHSPSKRLPIECEKSVQDSGFDSVANSINSMTSSFPESLNFGKDSALQISPLKRRANDDEISTISVESPMKRLAFMSLANNDDSGIKTPSKSITEPLLNEPGSSFLNSPVICKNGYGSEVPGPVFPNAIDSCFPKKQLFNETSENTGKNVLDDFEFAKPSLVFRRPVKKTLEIKSERFTRKPTTANLDPITESKQGQEFFDIVNELANRNMQHIIAKIFSHIRKKDILRCSYVSQSWSEISRNNSFLRKQIKSLKNQYQKDEFTRGSENITAKKAEQNALLKSPAKIGSKRNLTSGRYALCNLQERVRKSPRKPVIMPTTPSGKNRYVCAETKFEHTQRVKRTLEFEESVMTCPKCSWTAKIYAGGQNKAQCYRAECGYRFCVQCKKEYHWPKPCKIRSPVSPTLEPTAKSVKAASKKSKGRLKKRLLM